MSYCLSTTPRHRGLRPTLIVALAVLALAGLPFASASAKPVAPESHGRLGQLSWRTSGSNTAAFHSVVGFRRDYYSPLPNVGDTLDISDASINYGDGMTSDGMYHVVSVDATNNWFLATKDVTYAYASAGPFTAHVSSCCRLSRPQHINNPEENFRYEAIVDFARAQGNPTSSLPPIVDCPLNGQCQFQIVAVDPQGLHNNFRFATATEAGDTNFVQPGPPNSTNAATISPSGLYTWNTSGATLNTSGTGDTYYSTQVMIEGLDASNAVVTKSPVDFFIRLTTSSNRPPVFTAPTRPDGTAFTIGVTVGNYLALPIHANDPDSGDVVTLAVINAPTGSHFTPPAPARAVQTAFTWTPGAGDIGTYVLNFTATDQHGAAALISVSINVVAGCVPYFLDVASGPNPPQDYFFTPVQYLFCHGVISGYTEPDQTFTFRPYNDTTRAQFSKMIVLSKGWTFDTSGGPHFNDIQGNPFYNYIETAYHHGVISGYGDGSFRPYASITRGQLSKLIVVAQGWAIDTSGGPHFSDVNSSNPFYSFIETAYHHGIISGYGDGTFRWANSAVRGQISKILWNALGSPPAAP